MKKYFLMALLVFSFNAAANESNYLKPCQISDIPTCDAKNIGKAYLKADQELNMVYQRLLAALSVQTKKEVRQGQRLWAERRDKFCKVGTGDEDTELCMLGETLRRISSLKAKEKIYHAVVTNNFGGHWQSCFYIEERQRGYCVDMALIQEADQVRGTREEFVSYRTYEIEVVGRVDAAKNIAYLTELGEGNGREFMFKMCYGTILYYLEDENTSCTALAEDEFIEFNEPYERSWSY